jgi:hypothetical protein
LFVFDGNFLSNYLSEKDNATENKLGMPRTEQVGMDLFHYEGFDSLPKVGIFHQAARFWSN